MYALTEYLHRLSRVNELFRVVNRVDRPVAVALDYLGIRPLPYPIDVRLAGQLHVRLEENEDTKVLWHIFVRDCYRLRGDERVILDLGANIGLFSLYAAPHAPKARIFSVEPVASTFRRLNEHVRENGLAGRVTTVNCAVAGEQGERLMARVNTPYSQVVPAGTSPEQGEMVVCRTLSDLIDAFELPEIDFLKMDIERSEYEVLLSTPPAMLKRIHRMIFELHSSPQGTSYRIEDILAHLDRSGLRVVRQELNQDGVGLVEVVHNEIC
jgi:FkbM family methyltransferase